MYFKYRNTLHTKMQKIDQIKKYSMFFASSVCIIKNNNEKGEKIYW